MKINAKYVLFLKERISLLEVVRKHLTSEKVGILFCCPFCEKRTCDLIVNDKMNRYVSTNCSNKGDVFNFLFELHGFESETTLEYLSDLSAEKYLEKIPETVNEIQAQGKWRYYGDPR